MGERKTTDLKVRFDRRIRMQFHGAKVTSDAGLLAVNERFDGVFNRLPATIRRCC